MKKFLLLGSTLLLTLCMIAQIPVAYYPFSGNANDAIGTLNGTVNGATLTTDRFGNANSAYSFDGVDDAISFATLPMTNTDNFSLLAWVNPAVFSSSNQFNKMIVSLGPGSNGYNMGMGNNSGSGSGNELGGLYNLVTWLHSGSFFSTINTWYHVALVRENGITKFYMNAILAPNTSSASPTAPTAAFQIGGQDFDPTHYWNGTIDEVKIYNVALTALQIQQEYASSNQIQKPGSGNAISFNGSTQSINVPNTTAINFGTNDFSLAFWYNSVNNGRAEIIFEKRDDNCGDGQNWSVRKAADQVYLEINVPGPTSDVVVMSGAGDGKWHHLVFSRTATQLSCFKDGILMATTVATAQNVNNSAPLQIGTGPCSPFFPGGNGFFTGSLDEVQLWNTALTQSQIRDRMCKKITSTDPLYSNLVAYYNFDESSGTTAFDGTVNANNGILANSPTRVTSGAAIGNASSHDYINATKTTSLAHLTGESFTVTSTSGSLEGIHVYRVDEQPNILTGATGVGSNEKYFGVFQVNGTAPQYTAVYNYGGNPGVNIGNEFQLRLNKRTDNAATSWSVLTDIPNETANTITVTGESTEYILGKQGAPLPLSLISFTGSKKNTDALLQWKTANEINVNRFEVQRSDNGFDFISIGLIAAGGNTYSLTDINVFSTKTVLYYRLKSVDADARAVYSNIIKLSNKISAALTVYPNPVKDVLTITGLKQSGMVLLFSAAGKLLQQQNAAAQTITIDMSMYANGIYLLQYQSNGETVNQKIIKQ
jgi:hypothetical protein